MTRSSPRGGEGGALGDRRGRAVPAHRVRCRRASVGLIAADLLPPRPRGWRLESPGVHHEHRPDAAPEVEMRRDRLRRNTRAPGGGQIVTDRRCPSRRWKIRNSPVKNEVLPESARGPRGPQRQQVRSGRTPSVRTPRLPDDASSAHGVGVGLRMEGNHSRRMLREGDARASPPGAGMGDGARARRSGDSRRAGDGHEIDGDEVAARHGAKWTCRTAT